MRFMRFSVKMVPANQRLLRSSPVFTRPTKAKCGSRAGRAFQRTGPGASSGHRHDLPRIQSLSRVDRGREHFLRPYPENLGGFALGLASRREPRRARLLESLDAADIDVRARTGSLSVGNRQRVEIAKALSLKARVLILDEPTAVLTQHDVDSLFAIVRNLRSRGAAIIYISHRLDEIFALADRVTVLRDGQWVATQKVEDITEAELIRQMVGRALEEEPIVHDAPRRDRGESWQATYTSSTKSKPRPLLSDASLSLHAGEIVGLAGLIGSGRSELAQAIFGTLPPESGHHRT